MNKSLGSPRKMPAGKGLASPRSPRVAAAKSPRTPAPKLEANEKALTPRRAKKASTDTVEVMELPARLVPGSTKINLKGSSADRIRGAGDSFMRLSLECLSKEEIKDELQKGNQLAYQHLGYRDADADKWSGEEEEQEVFDEEKMTTVLAPDRARFNVWNGINYDLHVLGDFKSDFERRVKSFQRPKTKPISMDPFCRSESGLTDEPCEGEAFLIWETKSKNWQSYTGPHNLVTATSASSSEEENDPFENDSDQDSVADPEILEYIRGLKKKAKDGENLTGETYLYDEEFGVIRNLHRASNSLTNYGAVQDHSWMGKAHIFYPEMTEAEKNMLKAKA